MPVTASTSLRYVGQRASAPGAQAVLEVAASGFAAREGVPQIRGVRGKALTAAAEILSQSGQGKMSLKAIAEHAGIGIASIYHYFDSKDDLLLSLALLGFEDLRRDIVRFQTLSEFESPMQAAVQAFLRFAGRRPEVLSLMFSERLMVQSEALRAAETHTFEAYRGALEKDERWPAQYRANAALALWAMGRGIAGMTACQPDKAIPPEVFANLLAGASYLINHPE